MYLTKKSLLMLKWCGSHSYQCIYRFLCDFKWICQNKGVTVNLNLSDEKKFISHVPSIDIITDFLTQLNLCCK